MDSIKCKALIIIFCGISQYSAGMMPTIADFSSEDVKGITLKSNRNAVYIEEDAITLFGAAALTLVGAATSTGQISSIAQSAKQVFVDVADFQKMCDAYQSAQNFLASMVVGAKYTS